ncbi:MAG: hypothetical protein ABI442_19825 [Gemmatimonadaceae bacterium]
MHAFVLVFALHFGDEHPRGDSWFSSDKAKHFFTAALVQSASFGGLRATGLSRGQALAGATFVAGSISVGKELSDRHAGGEFSLKDLTWDAVGIASMTVLLRRTDP